LSTTTSFSIRCWWIDAFLDGDQTLAGHQLIDLLFRVRGETDVAIGQDADQTARIAVALDDGDAGNAVRLHQRQRVGERRVRADRHRVHHHARFEFLDLADLLGLLLGRQVAVDDAEAAGLGHRDREARLGHRVHRRGDDRNVELDLARQPRANVDLARHDERVAGLQQHVVKRECLASGRQFKDLGHGQRSECKGPTGGPGVAGGRVHRIGLAVVSIMATPPVESPRSAEFGPERAPLAQFRSVPDA
jgi:hypothetical protein